jgi:hypothetical protein
MYSRWASWWPMALSLFTKIITASSIRPFSAWPFLDFSIEKLQTLMNMTRMYTKLISNRNWNSSDGEYLCREWSGLPWLIVGALGPSGGVCSRATVATEWQMYHPTTARFACFIKTVPTRLNAVNKKTVNKWIINKLLEHGLTEAATRAPLYHALFSLRFSRKLNTS